MSRRRLPSILTPAEIDALLAHAHLAAQSARTPIKKLAAIRDLLMIQTGRLTGARVSEMCKLEVTCLDLTSQTLSIRRGKGDRDRNVPIADKLAPLLRDWLNGRTTGFVFPGPKGRKLSERTFQVRLDALAAAAGIAKRVHPHLLRHTFATGYLRVTSDLPALQQLMGHANLATTAIYLHVDVSRFKGGVDRL